MSASRVDGSWLTDEQSGGTDDNQDVSSQGRVDALGGRASACDGHDRGVEEPSVTGCARSLTSGCMRSTHGYWKGTGLRCG
jgi:hypothetical protein